VLNHLLKVRYLAVVVSVLAILHALAFFVMGTQTAIHAYKLVLQGGHGSDQRPGLELLHSLDFLLVGLVLIILAFGVARLFLLPPTSFPKEGTPSWLNVENFSDLKGLLWETILTAMVIMALSVVTSNLFERPDWTALIIPGVILILAISLYFVRKH
jgi:uncharacterized membrane protein YqhA